MSFVARRSKDLCRAVGSEQSADSAFNEIAADVDAEPRDIERRHRFLSFRYAMYMVGCLVVTLGFSALSIGLWSDMGGGTRYLELLQCKEKYSTYCAIIVLVIVLLLYMLDFFAPTHLPGRYLVLAGGNGCLGRGCLLLAAGAFVAWCFLMARDYPTLPLVITSFFCPMSVVLLRRITMPVVPERPLTFSGVKGLEDRIALIKLLTWEERDEKNFYTAATYSFAMSGLLSFAAWVCWAVAHEEEFAAKMAATKTQAENELLFARWAAPAAVAVSNLVYAGFAGLRVTQNGAYSATDQIKNQLIFDFKSSAQRHVMQYRIAMLRARVAAAQNEKDLIRTTQDKLQRYLVQHISHMRRLSKIVKSVGCTIVALIFALHIVFQMTSTVSHIAIMVQGFLASYLLTFAVFIFVSFNRVSRSISLELMDLPLLKNLAACLGCNAVRALLLCLALPFLPVVLAISCMNQCIRRQRGLARSGSLLTRRVRGAYAQMLEWEWLEIVGWCYIVAGMLMVFRMSPIFLNVLLAWMSSAMASFNFWMICAATFATGVFLFMLPPVPGPIIYPFAGIVISDPEKCPFGFVWGCVISIALSFVMKMAACAVQQKVIGEMLGSSVTVRRAVGIHKPAIRAIEAVLKQPGLSFGKCMILCGGPDWPTSVLAGILRLSIWQCLLGTCPVMASIIPMALTGSFYLKRGESEVWTRTGNLMLFVTTLVSAVFLVGIGWAIQDEYDKRGDELTKPRQEFLELEWLDYRADRIAEKCRASWRGVPRLVRLLYAFGAVSATLAGHLFLWCTSRCFGSFTLTDEVSSLRWYGGPRGGLIRPFGLAGLAVGSASYLGLLVYNLWYKRWSRGPRVAAMAGLAAQEADWKKAWLEDFHKHAAGGNRPASASGEARTSLGNESVGIGAEATVPTLLSAKTRSFGSPGTEEGAKSPAGKLLVGADCTDGTAGAAEEPKVDPVDAEYQQSAGEREEADMVQESVESQSRISGEGGLEGDPLHTGSVTIDVQAHGKEFQLQL